MYIGGQMWGIPSLSRQPVIALWIIFSAILKLLGLKAGDSCFTEWLLLFSTGVNSRISSGIDCFRMQGHPLNVVRSQHVSVVCSAAALALPFSFGEREVTVDDSARAEFRGRLESANTKHGLSGSLGFVFQYPHKARPSGVAD